MTWLLPRWTSVCSGASGNGSPAPGRAGPVLLHFLYQPDVAERWEPAAGWTAQLIRSFSTELGAYPYPQFTVAQAGDGGMEYPMFTAITGRRSPG